MALTDDESPAYLPGFFQIALGSVIDLPRITEAARTGEGVGWHAHVDDVHHGCEAVLPAGLQRGRREIQPDRPCVLRLLDAPLHAGVAVAGRGPRARRTGRRGADREVVVGAGLSRFRRAAETPLNFVFGARP